MTHCEAILTSGKNSGQQCTRRAGKTSPLCSRHREKISPKQVTTGRPTSLSEDVHDRIVMLIRAGNYKQHAASAVGVSTQSLYNWLERGEADVEQGKDTAHARFFEACARARGEAIAVPMAQIGQAANVDWRAAAWKLERMEPALFGASARIEHSGEIKQGQEVPEDVAESIELADELRRRRDEVPARGDS